MPLLLSTFILIMLIYAWTITDPASAYVLVGRLKRRWRQYLVQREGEKAAQDFARVFRKQAIRQGFDRTLIETVLHQRKDIVIERLGTQVANQLLGEPTPLELYE